MYSLATFNANNFFLRYRFPKTYPGDTSKKSLVDATDAVIGYMPSTIGDYSIKNYIVWDEARRELASIALMAPDEKLPDIICFQEVENIHALRVFNNRYLGKTYPYSLLIDSHDIRNIDVGILSRFPLGFVKSQDSIEDSVKEKVRNYKRTIVEGSEEYDIVVQKLYEDELTNRGML